MAATVVAVQDLSVRFGDFYAVKQVSFNVQQGEIFGFLGANGAGKTTTIRVLCGLLPPSSGQVKIAGVSYEDGAFAIKRKVGYMSQRFTLYNDLSVGENLSFIASLRGIDAKTLATRRRYLLDFVKFNYPLATLVKNLPGGLKQEVSLAAALLHDPSIIFLDEPTAGVSPAVRERFWALIRNLQHEGKSIFVTTHYMDEAENCGRIALLRDGELIALDSVAGLKQHAFSQPLFELEPKDGEPLSTEELQHYRREPSIRSLQAYGVRYHAVVHSQEAFSAVRQRFAQRFIVRETEPSLEDVFIELVAARKE
jgi:ABC-2 type transport system ATP-binding protein